MSQLWANLGTGGTALDARNGSGTGVDSNDAKLLEHDGTNYVYLPGVAGNYMSVPDEAALDITGDIDIRVRVAADSYATTFQSFATKQQTGTLAWSLGTAGTAGKLYSTFSIDGTTPIAVTSSDHNVANGDTSWFRVTRSAASGDITFYKSVDGASWTTISTHAGTAGTLAVNNLNVVMGANMSGTSGMLAAKVYRAQVLDGIGGTTVLDVDTSVITSGAATSFTATTGQTVTINRSTSGRKSVAVVNDVWLLGTANYLEIADSDLLDFGASDSFTVMAVVRQWATPRSFGRWVDKRQAVDFAGYGLFSNDTALSVLGVVDAGASEESRSSSITGGALSLIGMVANRTAQTLATFSGATLSSTISISGIGSLASSAPLRIGALGSGTSYQDFEVMAVAVFRRALTAGEISALSSYYATRFP